MKSSVIKRSIVINGHKTSVSLEDPFWSCLKEIARAQQTPLSEHVAVINAARETGNLSSAIRLFVLGHFRQRMNDRIQSDRPGAAPSVVADKIANVA
jgi:predicted DNA-binding ribbon-helix-helix protein